MKISFTIPGEPTGKARPRVQKFGTRNEEKTVLYENLVKTCFFRQSNGRKFDDDAQLDVRVTAYYQIPKSVSKKKQEAMLKHIIRPKKKPDVDNVAKIILDALNKEAYYDDAQVVDFQLRKFYSDNPRVVVTIQEAACG